ncbi:hypothetical protein LIER_09579 [Lithospermum erythrorhizon]|uniref:GPI-anchored protein LLG1-like domain-containing protein n=1 Tax=Lithospermum erythrorhizon TaxID=34254 RepID=A0AAV3PHG9_LITER
MDLKLLKCCMVLVFLWACFFTGSLSAATFLSDGIFGSESATGRSLLQEKKPCPVNFEFLNYTIITSKCKGPQYAAKLCCPAFLEFSCPYAEDLNDLSNNCASTMFSYINLYGKYPPGLFANECKGDKQGLPCEALPPSQIANDKSSQIMLNPSSVLMLTLAFLALILQLP